MGEVETTLLRLVAKNGRHLGTLRIALLPSRRSSADTPPLLDLTDDPDRDVTLEPIQLLEGHEYHYLLEVGMPAQSIQLEPFEFFEPDNRQGRTGRLRPGLSTGRVEVTLRVDDRDEGHSSFEVRSKKLDYLKHYRWMLRDIADVAAELVMERFAPAEQRFVVDDSADARTMYQRFQFLQSLIAGEDFAAAMSAILSRPYVAWEDQEIVLRPSQGIRAGSFVQRQWLRPGARLNISSPSGDELSIPAIIKVPRTEATLDNAPNRFVKFALERWRDLALMVKNALVEGAATHPAQRGHREVDSLIVFLDTTLSEPLFGDVGPLDVYPADNQVLHKREGYRELFRSYVLSELGSKLAWSAGDDVYGAGQRNVATLYEYWTFFQMARLVSSFCSTQLDLTSLVNFDDQGLNLTLERRRSVRFSGSVMRLGRQLNLELWFNRSFGVGRTSHGSWTRTMRPDVALFVSTDRSDATFDSVWLHFDAKYRVDAIQDVMGTGGIQEDGADEDEEAEQSTSGDELRKVARRDDLLKMHAYKDAIHRSAGAYVLYPGNESRVEREFHEILPGLGAFVLRPSEEGEPEGNEPLARFIDEVLTHLCTQISEHERDRYWLRETHDNPDSQPSAARVAPFLSRPPADTPVLLGYVKSEAHRAWIHRTKMYNLRAGRRTGAVDVQSRELGAEIVALYHPDLALIELWSITDAPRLMTKAQLLETGYSEPGGELYFCLQLDEKLGDETTTGLAVSRLVATKARLGPTSPVGAPAVVSWLDLVR